MSCQAPTADPEQASNFQAAATGATLWHLARPLATLDRYTDKYGKAILHGQAEYNAEAHIRQPGWTGELTVQQARELRFYLA